MVRKGSSYFQTVFLLFVLAALLPVILLSAATTGLSANLVDSIISTNVADSLETTGVRLVDFNERIGRGLVAVAANLQILALVQKKTPLSADELERAQTVIRERFREDEPPVNVYLVSLDGGTLYTTASLGGPYSKENRESRELLAVIEGRPAGITQRAKQHTVPRESNIAYSEATAVIGPSGKPAGYIIADVPRETLRTVLAPLPRIPELFLMDESGFIAFSLSSYDREGQAYAGASGKTDSNTLEYSTGRMHLVAQKPAELVSSLVDRITLITLVCAGLSVLVALVISFFLSRRISRPIMRLIAATKSVAEGDLSVSLVPEKGGDIALLMKNFNSMVGDLQHLFDKTVEEQELLKQAELDSLRSQINPHFFFNALSSISALAKLGACTEITTVTIALGKLLRSNIANTSSIATIADSLAETRNYLVIEKIRFADRFSWTEEIENEILDCEVPRLGIQSLVENALIHGIEPNPEASLLQIRGYRTGDTVCIEIEDSGVGMSASKLADINRTMEAGITPEGATHIGLANTNRRIRLEYGEGYGIRLRGREGGRTGIIASMTMPARKADTCTG